MPPATRRTVTGINQKIRIVTGMLSKIGAAPSVRLNRAMPACRRNRVAFRVGNFFARTVNGPLNSSSFCRDRFTRTAGRRRGGGLLYDPPTGALTLLTDHIPIVVAAQRGDRDAFEELYARFARFVYAILLTRVPPDEAGDLAQDVFMHAWTMIGSLREPAAFGGWIGAIARRRAIDFRRRRPMEVELDDRAHDGPPPDMQVEAAEALAAIRALPEAYRETLTLRLVEGCSGREIAALCGLTEDSVRVNLHRGFKLLRERLNPPGPEHER